jgi:hypothetical protein
MMSDRWKAALWAGVASAVLAPSADAGVFVNAASTYLATVGSVTSGQTVTLSVIGRSDIYTPYSTLMTPTGTPAYNVAGTPAQAWGASGSPTVPGTSVYGAAGPYANMGALVGTYMATPLVQSDYFLIGNGGSFTPTETGTLYALVNDSYFGDNCGGFFVTFGALTAGPQQNFVCASSPLSPAAGYTAPTPIATVLGGHQYEITASGYEIIGSNMIGSPAGIAPLVNGFNTGALLLSLLPNPSTPDIFTVGANGTVRFTAPADATLFAWVNAASYPGNTGGFVTQVAEFSDVPEPMSISLLLTGLGMVWLGRGKANGKSTRSD